MFAGGAQAGCLRRKGGYTGPCGLIGAPRAHPGPCGAFPPWYGLAARGAVVEGPGKSRGMGFCISCRLRAVRQDQLQTWHPRVLPTFRADSLQLSSTTSGVASNWQCPLLFRRINRPPKQASSHGTVFSGRGGHPGLHPRRVSPRSVSSGHLRSTKNLPELWSKIRIERPPIYSFWGLLIERSVDPTRQ